MHEHIKKDKNKECEEISETRKDKEDKRVDELQDKGVEERPREAHLKVCPSKSAKIGLKSAIFSL